MTADSPKDAGNAAADDERLMRRAIAVAREGIATGQTPFGACVARAGDVIAFAHNQVHARRDPTAHAEVLAIRDACRKLGTIDLAGCTVYSTCEPCPMCFAACHWAKVRRIVFACRIEDAQKAGFSELTISNARMKELGGSGVEVVAGLLRDEGEELFQAWANSENPRAY